MTSIPIDSSILILLEQYQYIALFVGAFIFGETIIIPSGFLASQGLMDVRTIFLVTLLATIISDSVWYFFGDKILHKKLREASFHHKYERVIGLVDRLAGKRPILALFPIKLIYGTRILTIIYLSAKKIPFWMFALVDLIASIPPLVLVIGLGWSLGKGWKTVPVILHDIPYVATGLFVTIILYKFITWTLSKKISRL